MADSSSRIPIAAVTQPDAAYTSLIGAFAMTGIGMALFFAPVANVVLSAVAPAEAGKASGANAAIREAASIRERQSSQLRRRQDQAGPRHRLRRVPGHARRHRHHLLVGVIAGTINESDDLGRTWTDQVTPPA